MNHIDKIMEEFCHIYAKLINQHIFKYELAF